MNKDDLTVNLMGKTVPTPINKKYPKHIHMVTTTMVPSFIAMESVRIMIDDAIKEFGQKNVVLVWEEVCTDMFRDIMRYAEIGAMVGDRLDEILKLLERKK